MEKKLNRKETIEKKGLVAPNDNYKVENCATCGEEFIKRKSNSTKQLAPGIRGHRSKNCSRMCARMYKRGNSSSINFTSKGEKE